MTLHARRSRSLMIACGPKGSQISSSPMWRHVQSAQCMWVGLCSLLHTQVIAKARLGGERAYLSFLLPALPIPLAFSLSWSAVAEWGTSKAKGDMLEVA